MKLLDGLSIWGSRAVSWASSRATWGAWLARFGVQVRAQLGEWALLARPGWLDLASSGSIWVPWALWLARFGRPGRSWLALAAQRLPHRHD